MKLDRKVRQAVYDRDNGVCQMCGSQAQDAHHILLKSLQGAESVENLILLCRWCHIEAHSNGKQVFKELLELQQRHYPELTRKDLKR